MNRMNDIDSLTEKERNILLNKDKKIIILDETNGKSDNGELLKFYAYLYEIEYYTDVKELLKFLEIKEK